MEINKLILKNFRTHRKGEYKFANGVTGIVGSNGTGKSSLVEAILFLLTGEGYGPKDQMLTVGEASGYVIGHLTINGKEAILERHLDSSKINLKYDGNVYKKSSDVAGLWDSLFQLDKHIMKNVVVSKQKDIALLFSGDASVREKLFQKIFMVPNTTKLRDIIWAYIKAQPPLMAVKNETDLQGEKQVVEEMLRITREQLATCTDQSAELLELTTRHAYLVKCVADEQALQELTVEEQLSAAIISKSNEGIAKCKEFYVTEDHEAVKRAIADMDRARPLYKLKEQGVAELMRLTLESESLTNKLTLAQAEAFLKQSTETAQINKVAVAALRARYSKTSEELNGYQKNGLDASAKVCPTCGSEIHDIAKMIEHLNEELKQIADEGAELKANQETFDHDQAVCQKDVNDRLRVADQIIAQTNKLETVKDIEYDNVFYAEQVELLELYDGYKAKLVKLRESLAKAEADMVNLTLRKARITAYDKRDTSALQEQMTVANQVMQLKKESNKREALVVERVTHTKDLERINADLAANKVAITANDKRQRYIKILEEMYEILHTSRLPRLLIQTYAETVSEGMNKVLASFDFPYTAQVNEQFGIDVFNLSDQKLPSVSGGQEVMIGMSLRLALHELFGGAFPFMIIDEGSDGLAPQAKKQYFEIIRNLKNMSKLKQIIVIDHDPSLKDVVDNVVSL